MVYISFLFSLCWYFGWVERWIWWKMESEISLVLNRIKVTIGSFELDFSEVWQGTLKATISNLILHTPHRQEWGWSSPVVARVGHAKVEVNAIITIFHLVFLKKEVPLELYSIVLSDVQFFIERHEHVFNVYLLDGACILPPPPFPNGKPNIESSEAAANELTSSTSDDKTESSSSLEAEDSSLPSPNNDNHETVTDQDGKRQEKAQKLVNQMVQSVESLGRAAKCGSLSKVIKQHGLELADQIRQGLTQNGIGDAKQKLEEGVNVLRTAGEVAVNSLNSTSALVMPERRVVLNPKPLPLCRVGRVCVDDFRIFTKDSWIQLQPDEDQNINISKSGWNKPIYIPNMAIRAAEMCPPMSAKDEDDLPAIYQTLDKFLEILWRRLLTEVAKSNAGRLFSAAWFETLNMMKSNTDMSQSTVEQTNSAPTKTVK